MAEILPKLKDRPEIAVDMTVKYGVKPEIEIDGKKLKTRYDKFDVLVQDFAQKLGLTLKL